MPNAFPDQFRRDVVAVARRRKIPLSKVAQDCGISESRLRRWMKDADVEEGVRDGMTWRSCTGSSAPITAAVVTEPLEAHADRI